MLCAAPSAAPWGHAYLGTVEAQAGGLEAGALMSSARPEPTPKWATKGLALPLDTTLTRPRGASTMTLTLPSPMKPLPTCPPGTPRKPVQTLSPSPLLRGDRAQKSGRPGPQGVMVPGRRPGCDDPQV